ncbi:MAG: MATE family efflux transporter [Candidatus Izemoplasma sp.]|nr:MATE family efflux transporter [Candidatus Izemoplasma sp.]
MQTEKSKQLGNKNIHKLLISLAIPATLGMMINALYNLADTIFVGRGVGEIAIGALSLAFPVQMIIMSAGLMIGVGSASVFSRAYGRNDEDTMNVTVNTALRVNIILASTLTILGFIFIDELLLFFRATESNIGYAKDYLSIVLLGLVPLTLSMVLNNLTRAEGRVRVAMYSMVIGAGLNIILDPFFIFDELVIFGLNFPTLGLGVKGAAIATVIAQVVRFFYIFLMTFRPDSVLYINLKKLVVFNFTIMKEIFLVGVPTFLRNAIGAFLTIFIFIMIEQYTSGDHAIYVSIFGVINRIILFLFMPAFGLVQGLAPIAGYNYGAKNYRRLIDVSKFAAKILLAYFTITFIAVQLFAPYIFTLFNSDSNDFFIHYGSNTMKIISIGFSLVSFQILMSSIYQSFGYAKRAMFVALSRQFILFVPLVFLFTYFFELQGLWYTFFVADILSGLLALAMFLYEMHILKKKANYA